MIYSLKLEYINLSKYYMLLHRKFVMGGSNRCYLYGTLLLAY